MKIKGFWHILLWHHWYSIVTDQLRILLTSGLYDACEEISIGCVGSVSERDYLQRLIVDLYPKLKIKYYSGDAEEYEFSTLKLIEDDESEYVGFYFHTKGVTRPYETIINHWRAWLNEAILNRWKEHKLNVETSFDVSSVNEMKEPDHFSGNFWWFNRNYIYRLPKIDTLDHKDRFQAEQWICMSKDRVVYAKEFCEPGRDVFKIAYL